MSETNGRRHRWFAAGLIVSWALTLAGGIWLVAAERQALAQTTESNRAMISDHEQRLRLIESRLEQIATDVRWIRYAMENGRPPRELP